MPDDKILFAEHHLSHAASAFFCSPFDEAAILTVDGVGEWATRDLRPRPRQRHYRPHCTRSRFPHSLGLLYSAFTAFLGFEVNEGEYKVMGMAPYGRPRYVDKVRQVLNIERDGRFSLNIELLRLPPLDHADLQSQVRGVCSAPPPRPGDAVLHRGSGFPAYFGDKPAQLRRAPSATSTTPTSPPASSRHRGDPR